MKKLILAAALSMAFAASAQQFTTGDNRARGADAISSSGSNASSVSQGGGGGSASASNQGNNQSINFISGGSSDTNITYGGSQTVNQNVNGTTTVNQNVSGTTTQNQNQNITGSTTQELTGDRTERQIVSGGTNSTIRQEFGTQKIKNTPSVNGAPLTTSNDTCMGSSSGSLNVPGVGIGLGTTWTDNNCVMLKNSRELWNMGMKGAAMALMCTDKANKEALELTGFVCPQTEREQQRQAAQASGTATSSAGGYTGNDPYIRARMGQQ